MEIYLYIGFALAVFSVIALWIKNKQLKSEIVKINEDLNNQKTQEVEIATLKGKLDGLQNIENELQTLKGSFEYEKNEKHKLDKALSASEQKLEELNNIKTLYETSNNKLSQKQDEFANLKEETSKYKTSLEEQLKQYEEFKTLNENRQNEMKEEIEKLKNTNASYNEEIKNYKSQLSKFETQVQETLQNSEKSLEDKSKYINELKETINALGDDKSELQKQVNNDKGTIHTLQTQLEEQNKAMEDKLELLKNSEKKLKEEFENLANKIFTDNSKKFSEQNKENLGLILNPMKQQLGEFKKKVEDVYDKEAKDRTALQYELKTLKELNLKMSEEAHKLTTALKSDNKKQGNWGEMVLDNVLESSGLRLGHEYEKQLHLKDDEDKAFKPDVVVHLPDKRDIIIDAKTSLTAYSEYMTEENEDLKQVHLKSHIKSVKEHIKGLADKKYEDLKGVNTLDFIFMFVPIEGALLLALENDVSLFDDAFKQKVVLVSPSTLLVALRAVENIWRYERQAQNIADVYYRAEELYKKFNNFIEDLKKVGKSIENANNTYTEAFKKLKDGRGSLISQVTMLKQVSNIKPKKEIDSVLVESSMVDMIKN